MDEQVRYEEAKQRVSEIKGFYQHLAVYVVINAGLVAINLLTSPRYLWFVWPLLGWGIGVALHALTTFGGLWGKAWEERKINEIMGKDRRSGSS
jgi:hypothetical protein